jgi:hypothetical protein
MALVNRTHNLHDLGIELSVYLEGGSRTIKLSASPIYLGLIVTYALVQQKDA